MRLLNHLLRRVFGEIQINYVFGIIYLVLICILSWLNLLIIHLGPLILHLSYLISTVN